VLGPAWVITGGWPAVCAQHIPDGCNSAGRPGRALFLTARRALQHCRIWLGYTRLPAGSLSRLSGGPPAAQPVRGAQGKPYPMLPYLNLRRARRRLHGAQLLFPGLAARHGQQLPGERVGLPGLLHARHHRRGAAVRGRQLSGGQLLHADGVRRPALRRPRLPLHQRQRPVLLLARCAGGAGAAPRQATRGCRQRAGAVPLATCRTRPTTGCHRACVDARACTGVSRTMSHAA